jgi:hypothetical protein
LADVLLVANGIPTRRKFFKEIPLPNREGMPGKVELLMKFSLNRWLFPISGPRIPLG